jgi:hypothetical protein
MKINLSLFFILFISCKDNRPLNGFWTTDDEDREYISGILIKDSVFINGYPSMNHNYVMKNLTDSSFVLHYPACHCADSAIVSYKIKDEELELNFRCDSNSSMQMRNIFGLYKPPVMPEPKLTPTTKKLNPMKLKGLWGIKDHDALYYFDSMYKQRFFIGSRYNYLEARKPYIEDKRMYMVRRDNKNYCFAIFWLEFYEGDNANSMIVTDGYTNWEMKKLDENKVKYFLNVNEYFKSIYQQENKLEISGSNKQENYSREFIDSIVDNYFEKSENIY